jgi:hypothetical protein
VVGVICHNNPVVFFVVIRTKLPPFAKRAKNDLKKYPKKRIIFALSKGEQRQTDE